MNVLAHAKQVLHSVRAQTDRVLLFYSGGKDSLALLDLAAPLFSEVVCVFMYYVDGLEHVERYLRFAEKKYPNVQMIRVPHFTLSVVHKLGVYCKAEPKLKKLNLADIDAQVREQTGITWSLYGMKQADSLNRRIWLRTLDEQAIEPKTGKAYPLSLWKQGDVLRYIEHHRLPKTISYGGKASSGVGFNLDCYLYLREHFPADLAKILAVYPASEEILFKHDYEVSKVSDPNNSQGVDSECALQSA